ncbi:MAG: carbohydrate-binding protein [Reichenbachiella sp.]|uniref:carbohydrate-binding protein n=1 Tax=Reichenbachiella sp. TaxID=2184521 RepID=UPI003299B921
MTNTYQFSTRKGGLLILLLFTLLSMRSPVSAQYVHTDGTQILDENGNDIYFSGINLGNWLLWEGYLMMGDFKFRTHSQFLNSVKDAFGGDWEKAREFEHQWRMNYVTQQGISDLKSLGFNSVRVPFHYNMFWDGNNVTDHGFQYFDRVIEFCRNEGLYVLLDMHAAPGHQNPGDHSDNPHGRGQDEMDYVFFWDDPTHVQTASAVWRHIADYYKNEPVVWGYDLINEPVTPEDKSNDLLPSLITMRNAIREVDNNHIIVAEGDHWGSDFSKIDWEDPLTQANTGVSARWDDNLVYQTHHYVFGNPHTISLLDGRKEITDRLNVPMMIGEYGEDENYIVRRMTDWAIDNNVDYFPWSFKKMSHDRTLWTIVPNQAYQQLKSFINYGNTPPASLYDDMIDFCQNNISNGSAGLLWHQGFYEAIEPPCDLGAPANLDGGTPTTSQITLTWEDIANGEDEYTVSRDGATIATLPANSTSYIDSGLTDETCYSYTVTAVGACSRGVTIQVCTACGGTQSPYAGVPASLPGTIEAENFDEGCAGQAYFESDTGNNGGDYRDGNVDISSTVDGDADYNVGWVEAGEWLEYTVDVASTDIYQLSYRVATPESTGQIQFNVGGTTLATTDIPATGDWNAWETVDAAAVELSAGEQVIQIFFSGGGVNLNSITLTSGPLNLAPVADSGSDQTLSNTTTSATLNGSGSYDPDNGPSALSYQWTQIAGAAVSISNGAAESPTVSGLSSGQSYEFQLVVNDGSKNSDPSTVTISVDQAPASFPLRIEAENYASHNGTQTEDCIEGGQNVGWIDNGDWIQFDPINIPASGTYTFTYRVASQNNQGTFDLTINNGSTNLGSVDVSESGSNGWQDWKSITQTVNLSAGSNDFRILITGGGFNINWLEIASGGVVIPNQAPEADAGQDQNLPSGTTSTSLDGSGSSDPDAGPGALTYSWTQVAGASVTISNSSAVSPTISGLADGESYTFQLVVNDGEDDSNASTVTVFVNNGSTGSSLKIEAEDYFEMYGLQTEQTSDNGGGQNVGWIDSGDWAGYAVDIASSGTYTVNYRVASQNGGGQIQLEVFGGGSAYGLINVPSTGGWQSWTTISHTVSLPAGQQNLALAFPSGGFNINWIEISSASGARLRTVNEELSDIPQVSLYPNPASYEITLSNLSTNYDKAAIYGIMGERKEIIDIADKSQVTLDISSFSPGLYFVILSQGDQIKNQLKFKVQ